MRVVVDRDVCEANGVCEQIAPQVFEVDDDEVLQILQPEVPADLEDKVNEAVMRCPKAALSIQDD
jgi:ferredoxin